MRGNSPDWPGAGWLGGRVTGSGATPGCSGGMVGGGVGCGVCGTSGVTVVWFMVIQFSYLPE